MLGAEQANPTLWGSAAPELSWASEGLPDGATAVPAASTGSWPRHRCVLSTTAGPLLAWGLPRRSGRPVAGWLSTAQGTAPDDCSVWLAQSHCPPSNGQASFQADTLPPLPLRRSPFPWKPGSQQREGIGSQSNAARPSLHHPLCWGWESGLWMNQVHLLLTCLLFRVLAFPCLLL